jgi:hypothetical protein
VKRVYIFRYITWFTGRHGKNILQNISGALSVYMASEHCNGAHGTGRKWKKKVVSQKG